MTKEISVGNVKIGGENKISVQSMTNTETADAFATLSQLDRLYRAGCDIVRVTVPNIEAAKALREIVEKAPVPVVADIHFDYKLALMSIEAGAAKIRINPGNIGSMENVKKVAAAAKEKNVPIRIGVNSGSIEKEFGAATPENMVKSAEKHIKMLEDCNFHDIAVSLKASDVKTTVKAYRLAAESFDYPLHIGVTEAGTIYGGMIRSSIGIGALLLDGIGDTLRVSLTADPVEEVRAGIEILKSLGLRKGPRLISCPTCGRTKIDLIKIADDVDRRLSTVEKDITVAVMGCAVNGPGEAKNADIGIAGGDGEALLFKKGKIIKKLPADEITDELFKEIERL